MLRDVKASARGMRLIALDVDGTGTAAIDGGMSNQVTLTDNGTGDYTITFNKAFAVAPIVVATPVTANVHPQDMTVAVGSVQIKFDDNAGTATDAKFHIFILGSDVADGFSYAE